MFPSGLDDDGPNLPGHYKRAWVVGMLLVVATFACFFASKTELAFGLFGVTFVYFGVLNAVEWDYQKKHPKS